DRGPGRRDGREHRLAGRHRGADRHPPEPRRRRDGPQRQRPGRELTTLVTDTAVAPIDRPTGDDPRPVRLAVDGLKKSYGKREAVKGMSFALTDGVTGLLGPNGAGKSTIIKCITGILDWDAGSITVDGVAASDRPRAARRRIGYMPERASFPPELTVRSYLEYAARMKGVGRRGVDEAVA